MNIFISGSEILSELDKKDIKFYLKNYASKHKIHLLCYRSLEKEVLRYFVENDEVAKNLSIYAFQELSDLEDNLKEPIEYLVKRGSTFKHFGYTNEVMLRKDYVSVIENIFETNMDLVVCFYNKDKASALIPLDIAKSLDIDAMYYELPGERRELLKRPIEDKIKII